MNSIVISGRLVKDVDVKETQNGGSYTRNTVAVDTWDGKNKQTKTIFVDFVAFSHSANFLGKWCHKGSRVTILGSLDSNLKESDDGKKVTYWNVIANTVEAEKSEPVRQETEETAQDDSDGLPFEV